MSPRVLIVAGMHRSGTSLLASLLHRGGCPMGAEMLPADSNNRLGYFEDVEFLDLNRRMLAAAVPFNKSGHADWGWTEDVGDSRIDSQRLEDFAEQADVLIAQRQSAGGAGPVRPRSDCW